MNSEQNESKDEVATQSGASVNLQKPKVLKLSENMITVPLDEKSEAQNDSCHLYSISWEAAKKLQYLLMGHSDKELDELARTIKDSRKRAGLISR